MRVPEFSVLGFNVRSSRFAAFALVSVFLGAIPAAVPITALAGPQDSPIGSLSGSSGWATSKPPASRTVILSTDQSRFDPDVNNQGWWSTGVGNENVDDNDNYFVGQAFGGEFRNFFTFDVSKLGKHVVSATLRLNAAAISPGSGAEVLQLRDVSTPAAELNENIGQNAKIFRDLGTGTVYGEYSVGAFQDSQIVSLELNKAALRDLKLATKRAPMSFFSIGGRLVNVEQDTYLFGGSNALPVELVVRTR